jgi:hypothetical protein
MNYIFGGIDVEQAKYKVVKKMENFEIRQYEPHIRIEVEMDSNEYTDGSKFMDLGGYIFGKNKSKDTGLKQNIAMTAPVITEKVEDKLRMCFVLPSEFKSIEELPVPINPNVKFRKVQEDDLIAVKTFSGINYESTVNQQAEELKKELKENSLEITDQNHILMRYNPPICLPFMRTNEVAFKILNKLNKVL